MLRVIRRIHLEYRGITIGDLVPIRGWNRMEFRDLFGNRVELMEPTHVDATM